MKGDFTRETFRPEKHYQRTLMQQGRVQLDADWNEQTAITAYRRETMTADVVGRCGGPADGAAFRLYNDFSRLPDGEPTNPHDPDISSPLVGDFILGRGHYYVDGIQCESGFATRYTVQPDRFDVKKLEAGKTYIVYLDLWQRHVTALDDPSLLDPALGGVDTATRSKTVWQVRTLPVGDEQTECDKDLEEYSRLIRSSELTLSAGTRIQEEEDPCQLAGTSGYKGLENHLYRVEIHRVNDDGKADDFKWSRDNGTVVTRLLAIDPEKKELTVESLGRNDVPGFAGGQFVEIIDDAIELEGMPGRLVRIEKVDADKKKITLEESPDLTLDKSRNPKLRRWDGYEKMRSGEIDLEDGIQVTFDHPEAFCRTGDYWLIPARAATSTAENGDIEWPRGVDADGKPDINNPFALLPHGIVHHYSQLGIVKLNADSKSTIIADCRCLYPTLNTVPRLYYVSGDGQEVMPVPGEKLAELPHPLQVYVPRGCCSDVRSAIVRFYLSDEAEGDLSASSGAPAENPPGQHVLDVQIRPDGIAECTWQLDATKWNAPALWTQHVEAQLVDDADNLLAPPVGFSASLSVANQVAYEHEGWCESIGGEYYEGTELDKDGREPALKRPDNEINFDGGADFPPPGLPGDKFSVRWTGKIRAQYSEDYTFHTDTDGGVRLWVGGDKLIEDLQDHGATNRTTQVKALKADELYPVIMEYYRSSGNAVAKLSWSSPRTPEAIIPQCVPQDESTVHRALDDLYVNYALYYVGGDGQEVVLQPGQETVPLRWPLQVRVANGQWPLRNVIVRFILRNAIKGQLKAGGQTSNVVNGSEVVLDVQTDANGIAGCTWELDPTVTDQQAEAWMLDRDKNPMQTPIVFNAKLLVSSKCRVDLDDLRADGIVRGPEGELGFGVTKAGNLVVRYTGGIAYVAGCRFDIPARDMTVDQSTTLQALVVDEKGEVKLIIKGEMPEKFADIAVISTYKGEIKRIIDTRFDLTHLDEKVRSNTETIAASRPDRRQFVPLMSYSIKSLQYRDGRDRSFDLNEYGVNPSGLVSDGTGIWVADETGNKVVRIPLDASDAEDIEKITLKGVKGTRSPTVDGRHIWFPAISPKNTVVRLDPRTHAVDLITVKAGPRGMAFDGDFLWVCNYDAGSVSAVDVERLEIVQDVDLRQFNARPDSVTFDGTHIWVAASVGNSATLFRIEKPWGDPEQTELLGEFNIASGCLEFDGNNIWLLSTNHGLVKVGVNDFPRFSQLVAPSGNVMTFDGSHLWVLQGMKFSAIDVLTDQISRQGNFSVVADAAAFDGTHLWMGSVKKMLVMKKLI